MNSLANIGRTHITYLFKAQYPQYYTNTHTRAQDIYWKDIPLQLHGFTYENQVFCGDADDILRNLFASTLGTILNDLHEKALDTQAISPSILASSLHEVRASMDTTKLWTEHVQPKIQKDELKAVETELHNVCV